MAPEDLAYREFDGTRRLATRGEPVSAEATDGPWRAWEPRRSKFGAMIDRGMDLNLEVAETVLYLGAAAGTTASHVADVGDVVYAVEFAPRPMRDLLAVAEDRENLIPLLRDARHPERYGHVVEAGVDLLLQDVSTTGQADVALENRRFLADDGRLGLAIKARSEDVTAAPEDVFDAALDRLREGYEILERERLDPLHDAHLAVLATPR